MYPLNPTTGNELLKEYRADIDEVKAIINRNRSSKEYKALRRPDVRFPKKVIKEFTTSRGNRYFTVATFNSRAEVFSKDKGEVLTAVLFQPDGRYKAYGFPLDARSWMYDVIYAMEYLPHLFEQYAQRMESNHRGLSLIKEFFSRNSYFSPCNDFTRPNDPQAIMMTCYDGAIFGEKKEPCFSTFKTFISSKTMQVGYKAQFDHKHNEMTEKYIKEYHIPKSINRHMTTR